MGGRSGKRKEPPCGGSGVTANVATARDAAAVSLLKQLLIRHHLLFVKMAILGEGHC